MENNVVVDNVNTIYLAGGCLWGVQLYFSNIPGVVYAEAGRANGSTDSLEGEYDGYCECVKVIYDCSKITLTELIDCLFDIIDPYSVDRQGIDVGHKYRTGIYSTNEEDLKIARQHLASRSDADRLALEVMPLTNYVKSAEIHQNHLTKYPEDCYLCSIPLSKLEKYVDIKLFEG